MMDIEIGFCTLVFFNISWYSQVFKVLTNVYPHIITLSIDPVKLMVQSATWPLYDHSRPMNSCTGRIAISEW